MIVQIGNYEFTTTRQKDGTYTSTARENKHMTWIDGKQWDLTGTVPTEDEMIARMNDYSRDSHNPQIGYHIMCPNCDRTNTYYLRGRYWMCFDCGIWFDMNDA